jgi:hypothetical protein
MHDSVEPGHREVNPAWLSCLPCDSALWLWPQGVAKPAATSPAQPTRPAPEHRRSALRKPADQHRQASRIAKAARIPRAPHWLCSRIGATTARMR